MAYKLPHVAAAFPVFCQKILPLTFDNSESYLEFVAHINTKLNEVIHALNAQNLAFNDFVNLVNACFESFKTDINNRFTEYKEEVQQALDDLEQAFNDDIDELQSEIDGLSDRVEDVENDVETLVKESGDLSVFPEKTTTVDYTMEIESANCNIYYKNPNSDIWHEHTTDTTINDFIVNETAESIGNKDYLFLFCPPAGYPEEQFVFSAGAVVTATAATSDDSAAAIYSRETIPTEDFNTGLVLCANGVVTTAGEVDTVVITNTDEVQNYSCLYLSNNFALALLDSVTYSFGVSVSEIFGTLYSEKTGQNVFPRVKHDSTLTIDSQGRLSAVSALPATLPDNLAYLSSPTTQTVDAYSVIYETPVTIISNFANGSSSSTWEKYTGTLKDFITAYDPWAYTPAGRTCYIFYNSITFPVGFSISCSDDTVSTGNTSGAVVNTAFRVGDKNAIPSVNEMADFSLDNSEAYSITVYGDGKSSAISFVTTTDKTKYSAIRGTGALMGMLKATLLNGFNPSNSLTMRIPSTAYRIEDENETTINIEIPHDSTLQQTAGVMGVSNDIVSTVRENTYDIATKQNIIDSTNKLSADLVDDSTTTNKFATAAQLAQIATNTTDIAGKQNTIDSTHMLSSDLVDDTDNIHKFATQSQLDQIALNETNILNNWIRAKNKLKNVATTQTVGEAVFTVNADKSISVYTTAETTASRSIQIASTSENISVNVGDIVSGLPNTDKNVSMQYGIGASGNIVTMEPPEEAHEITVSGVLRYMSIFIRSGVNIPQSSPIIFNPMICTAEDWQKSHEYSPYAMSNLEITAWILAHS